MNPTAPAPPTKLRELQEWFQAAVTAQEAISDDGPSPATHSPALDATAVDRILTRSSRLSAAERLAVYTNAYTARLVDCLTEMYPILARTLGEDVFAEFACDYLQSHPSRSYTLSVLGQRFPGFLADSRPPRESGEPLDWADFMIDLARLEWTIYEVFDGPGIEDVPETIATSLRDLPADQWPDLRLATSPCLRLVESRLPVSAYYTECRQRPVDACAPPMPAPCEEHLAVSRVNYVVRRYPMSPESFRILRALSEGRTLGEALEMALAGRPSSQANGIAGSLQSWFALWQRERFFENALLP